MGDSIFTQHAKPGGPAGDTTGLSKHHKHPNFKYADKGVNGTQYMDGGATMGMEGTVVPAMSHNGGVKGSDNPYGRCIAGNTIRGSADGKGEVVGELFIPPHLEAQQPTNAEEDAEEEDDDESEDDDDEEPEVEEEVKPKKAKRRRTPPKASGSTQDLNTKKIDDLLADVTPEEVKIQHESIFTAQQQEPRMSDLQSAMASAIREQDIHSMVGNSRKYRVEFKGSFGRYRGHYSNICVDGPFIALVYSLDEATYSPPASDELFTLSCGEDTHEVYFAGVEFTLPFMDSGVQVLIRKK